MYFPLTLIALVLLSSCGFDTPKEDQPPAQDAEAILLEKSFESAELPYLVQTETALPEKEVHSLPQELSLDHLATMRLEGDGISLDKVLLRNNAYTRYAIDYSSNGLMISGILNIPHGEGPFPLLLLNHGYINPSVYTRGRGLKREQDYLAKQGFAVLHSDYRGHGDSDLSPDESEVYDGMLEYSMDVVNAINAMKKADLPQVSTNKIGMLGHSMGGGIAMNIATAHPSIVDAVILYAPVSANAWDNFTRWQDMRDEKDQTRNVLGSFEEKPENWKRLSPAMYLHKLNAPVLLFHGTNDDDVPKEWSDNLAKLLKQKQKSITYVEYENEKHEFVPKWNHFMESSTTFFKEHLY